MPKSQLLLVIAAVAIPPGTVGAADEPLGATVATVYEWGNRELVSDAPSTVRLADGELLCTCPLWSRDDTADRLYGDTPCVVLASSNHGETWKEIARIPFVAGKLLLRNDRVYFIGAGVNRKTFRVTASSDGGKTWSEPTVLRNDGTYAASTGWVVRDDTLYWAFDDSGTPAHNRKVIAAAADLRRDFLQPGAWRFSEAIKHPGIPQTFGDGSHDGGRWLEPNVICYENKLKVIVRLRISGRDSDAKVPNIAAICDLSDANGELDLRFSHYCSVPGAQNHFHILHDPISRLFWMTSNAPTGVATRAWRGWGKERRILMLHYSIDGLNWFPAGCAAMWKKETQAYNYASLMIDGDDLLFVSRTAEHARNQHDNDKITFHRIPDFRQHALDLAPER
ncbi:sialidase family protein [Planctomycetota bacterium]